MNSTRRPVVRPVYSFRMGLSDDMLTQKDRRNLTTRPGNFRRVRLSDVVKKHTNRSESKSLCGRVRQTEWALSDWGEREGGSSCLRSQWVKPTAGLVGTKTSATRTVVVHRER